MTDLNTIGLAVGLFLVLWGIKDGVTVRVGRLTMKMSLGGFLIAASLGIIMI